MKIAVFGDFGFTDDQRSRLERAGEVSYFGSPESAEDLAHKARGFDIVCSDGEYLHAALGLFENVFVTYPFVEIGSFDSQVLAQRGVQVANARGGNRDTIVEWSVFMTLALFRDLHLTIDTREDVPIISHESLVGKHATIIGKGSIGAQLGEVLGALGMSVLFFERGDDLHACVADADLVINALNCSPSSHNLLDESFFRSLPGHAKFLTFSRPYTYDADAMLSALSDGAFDRAAIDCDPEPLGDTSNAFYQKMLSHPRVLVTPHIAGLTRQARDA